MRISTTLFLIFLSVLSYSQNVRHIETISECWKFHKGDIAKPFESNTAIAFEDIDLPHTWNALDVLSDTTEGGYKYYRGIGWYKRILKVPTVYDKQKVFLYFEASSQVTNLYVNGEEVGLAHIGGYNPFAYDITHLIKKENELSVKVDNSRDNTIISLGGDFNHYGGIYRDVHLIITNDVHFEMLSLGASNVFISTPEVSEELALVSIKANIVKKSKENHFLKNTILDANRNAIAETKTLKVVNGENKTTLSINKPELWSPESPNLYHVVSEITDKEGKIIDRVENSFGCRWFRFDVKTGFHLNGKHLKLIGTNRHQDYYQKGNALSDELHRQDFKLLKEMGINFLRISHYPQDQALLEMCNKYGIITTLEIPFVDQAPEGEEGIANSVTMMRELIRSNYNHPSIVAWCIGNETTYRKPKDSVDVYLNHLRKNHHILADVVKEEDTTRYSHSVFFLTPKYQKEMDLFCTDIYGYNEYFGWYEKKLEDIEIDIPAFVRECNAAEPNRPFILSEYGAGADPRLRSFNPERFDFSIEYQLKLHQNHLKAILNTPEIAGSNVWNFADFQASHRKDAVPHINSKGLVSVKREPKDVYYFYQAALRKDPVLVIPSKLWTNRSGIARSDSDFSSTQQVEIFSNLRNAELFLNGNSLGEKSFDFFSATWDVPFADGKNLLEVRSMAKGKEIKDYLEIDFKLQAYSLKNKQLPFTEIAVNVGSNCYFTEDDNANYLWIPDQEYRVGSFGYIGGKKHYSGKTIGSKQNILGTQSDPVYQTQLIDIESYKFDVPKGNYELTLLFAEVNTKGSSEMDIVVNEQVIWSELNIKDQYGKSRAVSKRFMINVLLDDGIQINFQAQKGSTRLSGIKLRKVY